MARFWRPCSLIVSLHGWWHGPAHAGRRWARQSARKIRVLFPAESLFKTKGASADAPLLLQLLMASTEIQPDLGDLVDRLAVQPGWLELIEPNCFKRGVFENRRTADELKIGYLAILAHRTLDHHRTGNVAGFGNRRISRRCP